MPSVEEFKIYDSVDSGNLQCNTYWIFIFWNGKSDFRLTSNISAVEQGTAKKIAVQKFTIEFYAWLISSSARFRRSAARGPKIKTFPPNFSKMGRPIVVIFVLWIGLT